MKRSGVLAVAGLMALGLAVPVAGCAEAGRISAAEPAGIAIVQGAEDTFERTLELGGGEVDLEVATASGDVVIRGGTGTRMRIVARVRVGRRDADPAGTLERIRTDPPIEQTGNSVRIGRGDRDERERMRHVSIDYEIETPAGTRLDVHTASGDQAVSGLDGPVKLNTGSGDLVLSDIRGGVRLRTGSGDIVAKGIGGGVDARSGSGDVEVRQAGAGVVELGTGSGDISVDGVRGALTIQSGSGDIDAAGEPAGDWRLHSSSGGITIDFPSDAAFDLEAETSSGSISVDPPVRTEGAFRRNRIRGQVGGGGARVSLRTSSGSIRVR